jgi:predicted CopG family antitoxin
MRSKVIVELTAIRKDSGTAMLRTEEASPSDEEVNNLHMKSEITCPCVRRMSAKFTLV